MGGEKNVSFSNDIRKTTKNDGERGYKKRRKKN